MKLVVGLGNIGDKYITTRHNVGFIVVDSFVLQNGGQWTQKDKFKAEVAQIEDTIFAKPSTLMNLSGEAVQAISRYYKIEPEDILVISDDIDLDFGTIRVRAGGGDGGHNGLKSIIEHIGSDFWRLRIGIANELREQMNAADFVLNNFSKNELSIINKQTDLSELVNEFTFGNIENKSLEINTA